MLQRYEERVDREKYAEELLSKIINRDSNSTNAAIFYGKAGIGKSRLSKSLYKKITQYYSNSIIINGREISNNCLTSNPIESALLELRNFLNEKSGLNCFDVAYLVCNVLGNPAEVIDLPLSFAQETELLGILKAVKKGLYQLPVFLQNTKYLNHYPNKHNWETPSFGSQILACLNWFFIQQTEALRQWWKLQGSKDLRELQYCATRKDIFRLLPLFLARDLQLHLQKTRQKAVVFIDNYEYLADAGDCNWLKDLIQLNPSILWVIFAEKPVDLTSNTQNIPIQNIPIQNLADAECQAIVQKFGIDNSEISQLVIRASEGIPLYLHLGVETYLTLAKHKKLDIKNFAGNIQDILPKLNAAWDWCEQKIWQILSNCRSWDEVLFAKLMSQFEIADCDWLCSCWGKLFHKVIKSPFVELNSEGFFCLHPIVRKYLHYNQPDNLQQAVNAWLFEYYQAQYQSQLHSSGLVKLLEYGLKSQQPQIIDWFLEQITLSQAGKHECIVFTLQSLLKYHQNADSYTLLTKLTKSLFALGDYQQALISLQNARKLWEAEITDNLAVANIELQLAGCYLKLQRTSEAENAAKKALSIFSTKLNHNSIQIAEALNLLTEIAAIKGYYSEALNLSQQALQIFETHKNVQHLQLAQTKFTTACLNAIAKNYDTALLQLQQTLDILNLGDKTHPLATYCHGMLGNIYQNMGYSTYNKAYQQYNLAVETAEINFGLTHPQTLQFITDITTFSRIRGEYDTVDFLIQRRHANMEISHFEETAVTADRLNKLGCLLYQQGKYASSENLLQQALQINCKVLNDNHPQTAESFHNLGIIYKHQRRYYTAEAYFKQALQIRCQTLGEKHPTTAYSLNSLAALYCCIGKYQQAEPLLQQALEICENDFGEMHPHTATTLNNLAQMYLCLGCSEKAEPIFQQALDICHQVLGKEHPYTKTVETNLNRLRDGG